MPLLTKVTSYIKRKTSRKYRFNLEYAGKQWESLRDLEDLSRYSLIIGYTRFFFPQGRLLDLGCGEGILHERYHPSDYSAYLGIDISDVAIENARKKSNEKSNFQVGNIDKLDIEGKYDAIIFNESLYYAQNKLRSVQSILKNLGDGGIIIISNYNNRGEDPVDLWQELSEILDLHERLRITNKQGNVWTLHIYKLK